MKELSDLRGCSDKSQPIDEMDSEVRNDFSSIEGSFIYRHHVETSSSALVPLRYIDVVRRTDATLDVLQASRIDEYWNIDVDRDFIGILDSFHAVHNGKWENYRQVHVLRRAADELSSNIKA